jgi:transcriptional regulator with GAF, ATPase, and Fis domain
MNSDAMQQSQENIAKLFELAVTLSKQIDFAEIVKIITQTTSELLGADSSVIQMVNPSTQDTVVTIYRQENQPAGNLPPGIQNQFSGWIFYHNQSLLSPEIKKDKRFANVYLKDTEIGSVMGVPLNIEGTTIGSLVLLSKTQNKIFDKSDCTLLEQIGLIVTPYLRNAEKLQTFFHTILPDAALIDKYNRYGLIGKSNEFVKLVQSIEAAARNDVRVLLEGSTGTGKEIVARAIHNSSSRANNPFMAVDCGAIPETLIESELFGHVKGTFTGATQDRTGLFLHANGGTIFLDEIANLSFEMQRTLLRVLQENEIRPVGSNVSVKINVRVIAAATTSLQRLVEDDKFRQDLYYRLYVYPISVPTLTERKADIPILAQHFLTIFSQMQDKVIESFHDEIISFLKQREWAGNIRELENFIERVVTVCDEQTKVITRYSLPPDLGIEFQRYYEEQNNVGAKSLQKALAEFERELLIKTLEQSNWNQSKAARLLNIAEGTLRYKMKLLDIKKRHQNSPNSELL